MQLHVKITSTKYKLLAKPIAQLKITSCVLLKDFFYFANHKEDYTIFWSIFGIQSLATSIKSSNCFNYDVFTEHAYLL